MLMVKVWFRQTWKEIHMVQRKKLGKQSNPKKNRELEGKKLKNK